jgi:GT2 family glycosyltransferase/SAM-dependent methyltransferase
MSPADYYEHERPELLEVVPQHAARVLDVGCAGGRLGEQIKRRQAALVWGIEVVEAAAQRAARRLDRVWNTSVETALLDIPEDTFDCIITADVLEHLVDPWTVLASLRRRLVRGGTLVASIPNVGHWNVIRDLLEGTWRYTSEGLLDRTHLRFFTRKSIRELFWTAGLTIKELTVIPHGEGVPASLLVALRRAGLHVDQLRQDGHVFQYRVVAERRELPDLRPRVGMVIRHRREKSGLVQCLESVQRLDYSPLDVLIVHRGRCWEQPADSYARFPNLRLLDAGSGHAGALDTNLGIRHALERGAEYVLILDDDTLLDQASLIRLMEGATITPEAGLWGPRVCARSHPDIVWATGFRWDDERCDFVKEGEGEPVAGAGQNAVHVVDALTDAVSLVRRDVFQRVGMFAPEYQGRWCEIDFCTRAAHRGYECVVVPAALAWHLGDGGNDPTSTPPDYLDTQNRLRWGRQHLGPGPRRVLSRRLLQEFWSVSPPLPPRSAGLKRFYWWTLQAAREYAQPVGRMQLRALVEHFLWRPGKRMGH